jgi:hypothetical protein
MFSGEMIRLIAGVVSSWQVIAATVALVLYFMLVSYVARLYHSPRTNFSFDAKPKKGKAESPAAEVPADSGEDDLGLEE